MRVGRSFGVGVLAVGAILVAACTSAQKAQDAPSSTTQTLLVPASTTGPAPSTEQPSAASVEPTTTIVQTVTRHQGGKTMVAPPPPSTHEPAPVDGECPYLSADVVSYITGQHHGQTQISDTKPYPICTFYRSDGGYMGSVRIIVADTPQAAIAAVDQHVPRNDSEEATKPEGWSGGLMTKDDGEATYGVSKGKIAVIAVENETPSIKARNMATCAIYGAKLEQGTAPDYCTSDQ